MRISYNGRNIDLIEGRAGFEMTHSQEKNENVSGSGKIETINLYGKYSVSCDCYFSRQTYRDLMAWWSWARQGKVFSFAESSVKVGNAVINAACASATTSLHLSTSTSFTVGDFLFVQAKDDEFEFVRVNSTSATGVGTTAALKYSYTSSDIVRHWNYFPSLIADMSDFRPVRTGAFSTSEERYYRQTFKFKESC